MTITEILLGTLANMTSGWAMPFTVVAVATMAAVIAAGDGGLDADIEIDEWSNL